MPPTQNPQIFSGWQVSVTTPTCVFKPDLQMHARSSTLLGPRKPSTTNLVSSLNMIKYAKKVLLKKFNLKNSLLST
jgi:hypothetical protein